MKKAVPLVLGALLWCACADAAIRPAAVAGQFYPGDAVQLRAEVQQLLEGAGSASQSADAIIVPHAGYPFSGATAAHAFAALRGRKIERVILLGPSHYVRFSGGALPAPDITAFATPMGPVPLDLGALARLRTCADFSGPAGAHTREHSLEVELPFLRVVAPDAKLVPVLLGAGTDRATERHMARCLQSLLTPATVVVASSDFTHHGAMYGWTPFANRKDPGAAQLELGRATAGRAAAIDPRGFEEQVEVSGDTVCGARPIGVLLQLLAHAFKGSGELAAITTSGQVSGNWSQVVTYAAVRFSGSWTRWREDSPQPHLGTLDAAQRKALLALARAALRSHLGHGPELATWFATHHVAGNLQANAGAFVTLRHPSSTPHVPGPLRACMGIIEARAPAVDAVVSSAVSAAHDPRFPQLQLSDLGRLELEVSVLSPPKRVADPRAIVLGRDGVVLSKLGRRAVYLPQVATETGWDLPTFLSHLSEKAGLPADAWRHGASFEVFTAQVFGDRDE